jgi:hypothetical protein
MPAEFGISTSISKVETPLAAVHPQLNVLALDGNAW